MDIPDELKAIHFDLQNGRTIPPVTIRTFLWWFGAQRRTEGNVFYINQRLEKIGIRTVPNYLNTWVDTSITFELVTTESANNKEDDRPETASNNEGSGEPTPHADPSFRVGKIEAANREPVSVKPNATLQEAITLMLARDFSQLPVMSSEREVKGVVSWSSISIRLAAGRTGSDIQSYMDESRDISSSASLFAAIRVIQDYGYVLIRATDRKITGLVTAFDVASEFERLSTPFLLVSEIENHLRTLISSKLNIDDIKRSCKAEHLPKEFKSVHDLNFGNYVRIFEHIENWKKIGLALDRVKFCKEIESVNIIRNEVMHFNPDPLAETDLTKLRDASRMLDVLKNIGAF